MASTNREPGPWPWSPAADEIVAGDQTLMLATVTPASGVVLLPVTNFVLRDRDRDRDAAGAGGPTTLNVVNTSVGVGRKIERVRANPRVALAYHAREHGLGDRPGYVLVQGRAAVTDPDDRYLDSLFDRAGRQLAELRADPSATERTYADALERCVANFRSEIPGGRLWDWWLRDWHRRVGIDVAVERVIAWPDAGCRGAAEVSGPRPAPAAPAPQRQPAKGTGPRIDHRRAAKLAARLPHALVGWVGADGFPVAIAAEVAGADERGIVLSVAEGLVPPGGRRAGFTAHWFGRNDAGLRQRVHTGWLEAEAGGSRVVYAPHTEASFSVPRSRLAFWIAAGGGTRFRVTQPSRAPAAVAAALSRRLHRGSGGQTDAQASGRPG